MTGQEAMDTSCSKEISSKKTRKNIVSAVKKWSGLCNFHPWRSLRPPGQGPEQPHVI